MDMRMQKEQRMEMLLEYDQRIARLEKECVEAVRATAEPAMIHTKRSFIKTQREHLEVIWHYAKAEGISESEYCEWKKARLMMAVASRHSRE